MHQGRGRPRNQAVGERILGAALDLLRSKGPSALTIDAVSARSGVARTTIYRRLPDRRALIAATLDQLVEVSTPAPELPVEEKLRWVLAEVRRLVELVESHRAVGNADIPALRRILPDLLTFEAWLTQGAAQTIRQHFAA